jgi:hypothetical protein
MRIQALTDAPRSCSIGISVRLGASRTSSVSGLKARPSTATVLPLSEPPAARSTRPAMAILRSELTV